MARKLLLVNLVILCGVILLAQRLVASWQQSAQMPPITAAPARALELASPPVPVRPDSIAGFLVVADKNLFVKERGLEPEEDEEEETAPEFQVLPKLTSVVTFGGKRQAVLQITEGRRPARTEERVVNMGDLVNEWQVSQIDDLSVTLSWRDKERLVLSLEPMTKPAPASRQSAQAVNIITVGSAAAAVETTTASAEEEEGRGVEVGVVAAQQQGRAGSGLSGARGQVGRGQQGSAARGRLGGSNLGGRSSRGRNTRGQVPVGTGSRPLPQNPSPPPLD